MQIITSGRTDLEEYFNHISSYSKLTHTPFLVFNEKREADYAEERLEVVEQSKQHYEFQAEAMSGWDIEHKGEPEQVQREQEARDKLEELEKETIELYKATVSKKKVIVVEIIRKVTDLLNYPDDLKVMGQWAGQWRSDFFQFTVGDFKKFYKEKNAKN